MYDVALFFHLLGVLLLVLSLSYTLGGLVVAQRAREVSGVRAVLTFVPVAERGIPVAMQLIAGAGLYMAARHGDDGSIRWSSGWLDVALVIFAVMLVLGPSVEGRRVRRLREAAGGRRAMDGAQRRLQRLSATIPVQASAKQQMGQPTQRA